MALLDTMKQIRGIADERTMAGPSDRMPIGVDKKQRFKEAFKKLDQEFKRNRAMVEDAKERARVSAHAMLQYESQKRERKTPEGQLQRAQQQPSDFTPQTQAQPQPQASVAPQQAQQQNASVAQAQPRQIRPLLG